MTQTHKITTYYTDGCDIYEIIIGGPEYFTIIKYRHGIDGRGEEIDYDVQPSYIQKGILYETRKALLS